MTDAPSPSPPSSSSIFRLAFERVSGSNLVNRAVVLAVLTLLLKIPLSMVDGVIADRQSYENEVIECNGLITSTD